MTPKFNMLTKLALTLVTAVTAVDFAFAETPSNAEIKDVRIQGTGCDQSHTSVVFSPDLRDMSVLFDDYAAEIGNGSRNPSQNSLQKDCRILVDVAIPAGWQMAFRYVDYRGFAALPASAWAWHRFSAMVPNAPITSMREAVIKGPSNQDYQVRNEVRPERMVYSPCGGNIQTLQLFSQLSVNYYPNTSDRSIAQIVLDSQDGSIKESFGVDWRRCSMSTQPQPPIGGPRPPGFVVPGRR